jgi:hypothetical protein
MSALGSPSPLFLASAADAAAAGPIKSVRFNNDDSAYLNRSATDSGSNVYKYTVSWWMKIGSIGTDKTIVSFATNNAVNGWTKIHLRTDNRLSLFGDSSGTALSIRPTMLFRDPSAWYHCVVSLDTTQSSYSSQAKFYINGVEQTVFTGTQAFAQNTVLSIGEATTHHVGVEPNSVGELRNYFDGYIADLHVIEGQIKQATDFGAFDDNGVWQAANYTGTYGNNGYHLFDFANETGIGDDSSGNDNDFTTNNLSASVPTVASFSSPSWSNPGSFWNVSDQDSNSKYQTATYAGSSQYSNVTSDVLASNTTYHFFLEQYAGSGDYYGGWFFVDGTSAPSNTVPDELGGDTLGLRVGETSAGTYGSYATANGTSQTQNQIDLTSIKANSSTGAVTFTEFVINTSVNKVWVRAAGASSWIGGGDPSTSSSTPSFYISNASNKRFGYVGYQSGTYAKYKSTAGSASEIDLVFDVPTNGDSSNDTGAGGEVSGNYCTLNALQYNSGGSVTLSNGNLDLNTGAGAVWNTTGSTIAVSSGKWLCEVTINTLGTYTAFGVSNPASVDVDTYMGIAADSYTWFAYSGGGIYTNSAYIDQTSPWGSGTLPTTGDVVGMALDMDAGTLKYYLNGSLVGTAFTGITGPVMFCDGSHGGSVHTYNFGQRAFAYPVSGYKALCTTNLPTPTIADGSDYFDTKLWTGNGSTQNITGYNFSPDLVWTKQRNSAGFHALFDPIRGVHNALRTHSSGGTYTDNGLLTAFNSDGFSVGSAGDINGNNNTYVGWAWDAGTSNTSISAGDLNSSAYNQSATWSTNSTLTLATGAFDGSAEGSSGNANYSSSGNVLTSSSITINSKLEIYTNRTHTGAQDGTKITINGTAFYDKPLSSTGYSEIDLSGATLPLTSSGNILIEDEGGGASGLWSVRVDGKRLVDSNVTPPNVPSIASTVKASQTAGMSIVTYSGTDTGSSQTIGHGLNAAPKLWVFKNRSAAGDWIVYTTAIDGSSDYGKLNGTDTFAAGVSPWSTAPTSSVVTVGTNNADTCNAGDDYLLLAFTPVAGYSAFGSYQGNGNASGPMVYTGFRPAFILTKGINDGEDWYIRDTARSPFNEVDESLRPNDTGSEYSGRKIDILSNGFKIRDSDSQINENNKDYLYYAVAENPFQANGGLAR